MTLSAHVATIMLFAKQMYVMARTGFPMEDEPMYRECIGVFASHLLQMCGGTDDESTVTGVFPDHPDLVPGAPHPDIELEIYAAAQLEAFDQYLDALHVQAAQVVGEELPIGQPAEALLQQQEQAGQLVGEEPPIAQPAEALLEENQPGQLVGEVPPVEQPTPPAQQQPEQSHSSRHVQRRETPDASSAVPSEGKHSQGSSAQRRSKRRTRDHETSGASRKHRRVGASASPQAASGNISRSSPRVIIEDSGRGSQSPARASGKRRRSSDPSPAKKARPWSHTTRTNDTGAAHVRDAGAADWRVLEVAGCNCAPGGVGIGVWEREEPWSSDSCKDRIPSPDAPNNRGQLWMISSGCICKRNLMP